MADKTRVLVLGGGFGGLYAALEFEKRNDPRFEVTVEVEGCNGLLGAGRLRPGPGSRHQRLLSADWKEKSRKEQRISDAIVLVKPFGF
jgi:hypothetical protein